MYNPKDIQFVNRFDFDRESAERSASHNETFSVGIFEWLLKSNGKEMKRDKCCVRVHGLSSNKEEVFKCAKELVYQLDSGATCRTKNIYLK